MTSFVYPLVAIRDDGTTIVAATPDQAAAFNKLRPGANHREQHLYIACMASGGPVWRESMLSTNEWIVRDALGNTVLHEDLPCTDLPRRTGLRRQLYAAQEAAARGLPIPGTGNKRRYSCGYRSFRLNMTARRADLTLGDDLADWNVTGHHVGRCLSKGLPQVWNDVPYRWGRRSGWKTHRATQWRG